MQIRTPRQHIRKTLTEKQVAKGAVAKAKKARKPLTRMVRKKKTQCSSHLTLTVQLPTKKQTQAADVVETYHMEEKLKFQGSPDVPFSYRLTEY